MSYAIRNDLQGWRAVDGPEDCTTDEYYSLTPVDIVVPVQIPQKVTMRQARLTLHEADLLQSVEDAINTISEPSQTAARTEWDYSSEVHRKSPFVALLGAALELDEQSLDDLFIRAVEL